jgi:hypothetical protein
MINALALAFVAHIMLAMLGYLSPWSSVFWFLAWGISVLIEDQWNETKLKAMNERLAKAIGDTKSSRES